MIGCTRVCYMELVSENSSETNRSKVSLTCRECLPLESKLVDYSKTTSCRKHACLERSKSEFYAVFANRIAVNKKRKYNWQKHGTHIYSVSDTA